MPALPISDAGCMVKGGKLRKHCICPYATLQLSSIDLLGPAPHPQPVSPCPEPVNVTSRTHPEQDETLICGSQLPDVCDYKNGSGDDSALVVLLMC